MALLDSQQKLTNMIPMNTTNYKSRKLSMMIAALSFTCAFEAAAQNVIIVSVDGLRPSAITSQGAGVLPNFYRFRNEGAFTDDARADETITKTLPNHVSMITGRQVAGASGHNWTSNSTPPTGVTLHTNKGSYVNSIYNVADTAGVGTSMYASKGKFSLFQASYSGEIDSYVNNSDTSVLVSGFTSQLVSQQWGLSFLHLRDADSAGHSFGFGSTQYLAAVANTDNLLGQLLSAVEGNAGLASDTTIILTSDHGGTGTGHSDNTNPLNYTVPLYVWGAGAQAGADLYALNPQRATIKSREVGNLAMDLLNLPSISGSTGNVNQDLSIAPEPSSSILMMLGGFFFIWRRSPRSIS